MAVFKPGAAGGVTLQNGYANPDNLGTGKGNPQGNKFLTDNQTFEAVTINQINSGAATDGQILTADGSGNAAWESLPAPTRNVRYYLANDTYTKPTTGFLGALVICVGAGGAGGSGRRDADATNRTGGSGGGGAAVTWRYLPSAAIVGNQSITIAAMATGGAAITANTTNGNDGATGGDTSFGALVVAKGGIKGLGGIAATSRTGGLGGAATACTPPYGPNSMYGGQGGNSATGGNGSTGFSGMATDTLASNAGATPGGGGGGGINTTNTERNGGAGQVIYFNGNLSSQATGGTINATRDGGNGSSNVHLGLDFAYSTFSMTYGIGTSGGGGASEGDGVTAAGNGGDGGNYGAGGGGGGASANGANSGAGGDGGAGLCIVIEYYN